MSIRTRNGVGFVFVGRCQVDRIYILPNAWLGKCLLFVALVLAMTRLEPVGTDERTTNLFRFGPF